MKTASLALLIAALPVLAQAQTPQPTPGAEKKAEKEAAQQAEVPSTMSWWQNRRLPRPVAARNVSPAKEKSKPAAKAAPDAAPTPAANAPVARPAAKPAAKPVATPAAKPAAAVAPAPAPATPEEEAHKKKGGVFGAFGRVFAGDKEDQGVPVTGRSAVRRALPAPNGKRAVLPPPPSSASEKPPQKTVANAKKAPVEASPAPEKHEAPKVAAASAPKKKKKEEPAAAPEKSEPASNDELALPGDSALPQVAATPKAAPRSTPPPPPAVPQPKPVVEFDRKNYLEVKQKAAQDPKIAELGKKLETATSGEAHKTAARRYTKTLFKKMNELDSSQPEWFKKMEAATIRRIDSGKPISAE